MKEMREDAAERLGYDLYEMGFRPWPDIDEDGRLCGVRMWRSRPGFLEYITVRSSGVATAGRVVAEFDYRRPFEHGPVLETRRGYVVNVLQWLLSDTDVQRTQPIPVVVADEVVEARQAARSLRHTPPWEDPNRLMAGRSWEPGRECAGHAEPDEDTARHRLTDTARHRLKMPDDADENSMQPGTAPTA